jgi:DNA-3-methyladenine glycosylase I
MSRAVAASAVQRCGWCGTDPLYVAYHDLEWGVPSRDDRHLFEMLTLEGAQAGLSWLTILRKREGYRRAFAQFDLPRLARFGEREVRRCLADQGIVRHRGKIESTISNARAALAVQKEFGSLAAYLWSFVPGGVPLVNRWSSHRQLPAQTELSRAMSRDLLRRGFRFVGPTTCYAFMQAVGMVDDHETGCFRRAAPTGSRSERRRAPRRERP